MDRALQFPFLAQNQVDAVCYKLRVVNVRWCDKSQVRQLHQCVTLRALDRLRVEAEGFQKTNSRKVGSSSLENNKYVPKGCWVPKSLE